MINKRYMNTIIIQKKSGKPFPPIEGGWKTAIAVKVVDNPYNPGHDAYELEGGSLIDVRLCNIIND